MSTDIAAQNRGDAMAIPRPRTRLSAVAAGVICMALMAPVPSASASASLGASASVSASASAQTNTVTPAQFGDQPAVKTIRIKDGKRRKSSTVTVRIPKAYRGKRMKIIAYPALLTNCVYGYECGDYIAKRKIKKWLRSKKRTVRFKLPIDFCKSPPSRYPYAINKADISFTVRGEHVGSLTPMAPNRVYPGEPYLAPYPSFDKANGKTRRIKGC